jgi:hypothetical protein
MAVGHEREPTGTVPFWAHQLAEMLLGVVLLIEGARTGQHTAVLFTMGAALLVLSLCSDGALGAWPLIGRRVHRVVDFTAAAVLAALPFVLSLDAALAIVVLEAAALGMVWLALRTNWTPKRGRSASRPVRTPPPPSPDRPPSAPASAPAPPLARRMGTAAGKVRDDGPRQLGRMVGRARRRRQGDGNPPPHD